MKGVLYFTAKLNSGDIKKMWLFLGTPLWSVRLCSQSNISRANGGSLLNAQQEKKNEARKAKKEGRRESEK